jgi:putative N6-adenine-specific DNA methylase
MSEQDSGRKTLSIKPRAKTAERTSTQEKPRTRIGARARKVAQITHEKVKVARKAEIEHPEMRPVQELRRADDRPGREGRPATPRTGSDDPRRTTRQPGARVQSSKGIQSKSARPSSYERRDDRPQRQDSGYERPSHRPTPRMTSYDDEIPASSWDEMFEEDDGAQSTPDTGSSGHDQHAHPYEQSREHEAPRIARSGFSGAPRIIHDAEIFAVFAPCPMGLEEALAAELTALGYDNVEPTRAGCHFEADWWGVQRANLYSRLATRILVRLGQAPVQREDDILELAQSIAWERWFGPEHTLRVDTSAVRSPMQSLQYCNLRAKDGICDRLRELEGARPSIDTVRPDARVHLFLSADTATLYLDTSGESLFKRGWRFDKGDAPLRENLAAGILALSGWDPAGALIDPFCGSGTILIEAAWIALGVPPGITRPFGFERLRDHEPRRWADLKEEATSRILPGLEAPLVGIDADPMAIEAAQRNAERAFLTEDTIHFELGDARDAVAPAPTGWMVTNPPYGERLDEEDLEFWREWSSNLKKEFAGWQVNIITSDLDLPKHLRLKANRRTPIFNGALDCRLFNFELVSDSYRT